MVIEFPTVFEAILFNKYMIIYDKVWYMLMDF